MKNNLHKLYLVVFCLLIFLGLKAQNPQILIKTELGDISIEVYTDKAPVTAANFLRYVDENRIEGATFYRVVTLDNQPNSDVKIEVIQGGLSSRNAAKRLKSIQHETTDKTGILHKDGAISMARNKPGTANYDFFICVGDQAELDFGGKRNPDGQGFAAFGRVIKGMDVVRKIQKQPTNGQRLITRIKIISITWAKQ